MISTPFQCNIQTSFSKMTAIISFYKMVKYSEWMKLNCPVNSWHARNEGVLSILTTPPHHISNHNLPCIQIIFTGLPPIIEM